ncbi:non-ribosomal peptide synthetase [Myxococcus xanthus]|uniref:amino acid adenylation domain-containing protein n=1 Tax=Myxococcus xanthus TaxID=34 RepID=UPI0039EF8672
MLLASAREEAPWSPTLLHCLRHRASTQPDAIAYTFVGDDASDETRISYRELDRRARAIAASLQRMDAAGERAILLYPPGLDYVAAFLGCLYANVIAVPAYPPDISRLNRSLPRLQAILTDARASIVLTTEMILSLVDSLEEQASQLRDRRWLATDLLEAGCEDGWREPEVTGQTLAFLQYTSGSTGTPKGVMLTHGNLVHNSHLIGLGMELREGSVAVNWLPPYHDMGLIGGILQPLYNGFHGVLLSPITFLQRPLSWLQAIERHRGTCAGGPNFAFDLCVRKTRPEEREQLDLRTWQVAFCGAEPIRPETLARFARAFEPAGFRPEFFYPCYGLAEATLIAAGGVKAEPVRTGHFDARALQHGQGAPRDEGTGQDTVTLVSSGTQLPTQSLVVVDPQARTLQADGEVGEIWMSGPSVAQGYWGRPEETERVFQARLARGEGPFLRTGDLGFLRDGQLFVTGRAKDLIIIRGRNHYPQDLEQTTEQSHPAIRPGCSAAFSVDVDGEEHLAVAFEVSARQEVSPDDVATSVQQAIAEHHQLGVHAVLLLKAGALPKTSSGKIQRHACRAGFLDGTLELIGAWRNPAAQEAPSEQVAEAPHPPGTPAWLRARVAALLRVSPASLDTQAPLTRYGLDSLQSLELHSELERELGIVLPLSALLQGESLDALARRLTEATPASEPNPGPAPLTGPLPLSYGQQALWFLHALAPTSAAYHVARAVRVRSALDVAALRQALHALMERHPALRIRITSEAGQPRQEVMSPVEVPLRVEDASGHDEAWLRERVTAEAERPFDLGQAPLFRVHLWTRLDANPILLLTLHHAVTDFWSLAVMAGELGALYAAALRGRPAVLPPLPLTPMDHARWQREALAASSSAPGWAFWKQQLAGKLPVLELPTDATRPPQQRFQGASRGLRLTPALTGRLRDLAREHETTLYTVLVAAFQALLHRYTGQDDLIIGSPASGRTRARLSGLVGYFTNPLPLRARFTPGLRFDTFLQQVRATVLGALEHQDIPFPALVEQLQPKRDPARSPIFQAMLVLQKSHVGADLGLEALALDEAGVVVSLGELDLEAWPLNRGSAQFDLSLALAETREGLCASMEYDTALFKAGTIDRMLGHLRVLLEAVTTAPTLPIDQVPLLTEEERAQLLDWNATAHVYEAPLTLHGLFEAQAARTPEAVALCFESETLTYGELDRRANQLAHHLRGLGVGPEHRVGVCLERSLELVVSLLGVLKAGGAYVPLDPSYPQERLDFMLRDAAVRVLLTQQRLAKVFTEAAVTRVFVDADERAPFQHAESPRRSASWSESLAYVIYTSGSTGRPKGAMNTHAGVRNRLLWMQSEYGLSADDRVLQKTPLSFDVSVWEFFWPLMTGARLVLARPGGHQDPAYLKQLIQDEAITTAHFVPSMMQAFLAESAVEQCASLRRVFSSGEALSPELRDHFVARLPETRLYNLYGPTEAAVDVSAWDCHRSLPSRTVPIGQPVANTALYVLDTRLAPLPVGVPGELYIGGVQVGRGYLGRPDLTAERFVPDGFAREEGMRMYRTGDRARVLPDGSLEYLGRLDHQVKVRGHRIELGEIEATLEQHPAVQQAVVLARTAVGDDVQLVAFISHRGHAPTPATLRDFLAERLPGFMVPSHIGILAELPLGPSGKRDRLALASVQVEASDNGLEWMAPRTPTELTVARIWSDVLKRERIGANDDFFQLGGHSLLATRVVARLRAILGVEVPLHTFFAAPTVAALAERLQSCRSGGPKPPPLHRRSEPGPAPLSFAQERLWLFAQMTGPTAIYNMPSAVRLKGTLDVPALERALGDVVRRHEALRTVPRVEAGAEPVQVVLPAEPLTMPRVDLRAMPEEQREPRAEALAREEAALPFDLDQGPLLRARLLQLEDTHHILLLTLHHSASDGWSMGVFAREVSQLYGAFTRGEPSGLPELPVQYSDYALWQRRWLESGELERQLRYWEQRLDALPRLQLRTDRPRPTVQRHQGRSRRFLLPQPLVEQLEALGRAEGVTLFMVLLGVYNLVLHRYSGQDDIVVGTDVAHRNPPEVEGLIGFFTNQLVLRADLSANPTVRELLARLRQVTLDAYEHQDVPFERLVRALKSERDAGYAPLFQVKLVLQNAPPPLLTLQSLHTHVMDVEGGETARWDLLLDFSPGPEGLWARAEYNTDLFDDATIVRLWEHFLLAARSVPSSLARPIATLPLLLPAEQELLARWNDTATGYPRDATIQALFEAHAAATPDAVALTCEHHQLTYGALNQRANQVAHHLRALGVSAGARVGLCLERSLDMVVALLGILKAGGAYLPLDPTFPPERLGFLVQDARMAALVTRSGLADDLPVQWIPVVSLDEDAAALAARPTANPTPVCNAEHLAYVLYTSGSTGKPKGVAVPQRAVVRLVRNTHYVHLGPDETLLQFAPLAFDASTFEVWGALLNGARLAIHPPTTPSLEELGSFIARQGVTTVWLTAGLFHQVVDHALESLASVRQLLAGGDVLSPAHVRRVVERYPGCRVINGYGPTENTTFTCCHTVSPDEPLVNAVPIGRPISNTRIHVLNAALEPVPVGAPGELCAGGDGLALGYLNDPALTAQRFIPDPFSPVPGARLYRTGDRCHVLPDGRVEFLGRVDEQVKLRGFRIEPGEIEAALALHPTVHEARVMAREDGPGEKQLVAYLVARPSRELPPAEDLRRYLQARLPVFMVPSAFVTLAAFPLTANGKVDRRALPAPTGPERAASERYVAPRTADEEVLAGVWSEVLGVDTPSLHDSFFDAGGDSIRAIQFVARAAERGLKLSVAMLLENQTLQAVAEALRAGNTTEGPTAPTAPFDLVRLVDRERLPAHIEDAYPLAALQGGMLFQSQLDTAAALYHDAFSFHLELDLDVPVFQAALQQVFARHTALRTSFELTRYSEPLQFVHRQVEPVLAVHDLRHLSTEEQDAHLEAWLEEDRARPFDWSCAPLMRVTLHLRTSTTVQLSATFHHAILDGWSVATFFTELLADFVTLRGDRCPERTAPALPFREFIAMERETLQSPAVQQFWAQQLDGMEVTSVTRTLPPPPDAPARGLSQHPVPLAASTHAGLQRLARLAAVPLKSVLLAAHLRVLGAVCGTTDVVTGLVSNGRPEVRDGERTLGLFLNSVAFRQRLGGGTWVDLVRETFATERRLLPHRRYPLSRLQHPRSGQPPFEVLFNFVHFHVYQGLLGIEGVRLVSPVRSIERLDLPLAAMFGVDPVTSELQLSLHHDPRRLDAGRVPWLAECYARVLDAMAAQPQERHERVCLLSPAERERVLVDWNATRDPLPEDTCVHHLVETQASHTPDAPAVTFEERSFTYRQLDEQATLLARRLQSVGVGPDARVAIVLDRSLEMVVAMLGVLKAGGAYVPLDPAHPKARLEAVLQEAHPAAVVTRRELAPNLPVREVPTLLVEDAPEHPLPPLTRGVAPRNLAYVLYTSGSTGRPKGVMVDHGNLVNHFVTLDERIEARPAGTWLAVTPYTFDISGVELVWTLTRGFHLVIHPEERHARRSVAEQIEHHAITHLQCTPSRASLLLQSPGMARALARLRVLVLGGEALTPALAAELRTRLTGRLLNIYGPTETTIWSTTHAVEASGPTVPIGRPVSNTEVYIVDAHGTPVPMGAAGELLIGGEGVSRGYLHRPELTAERFIPNPFSSRPGARLYRTGDACRYQPGGVLEFLGRIDQQVKIRGYRIELGEVEAVLREHPALREAAVVARTQDDDAARLVAYLVPSQRDTPLENLQALVAHVRAFLRERLPEYMVPSAFVPLEALPLNASGKVDRQALPQPSSSLAEQRPAYIAPAGQLELDIAEVWRQDLRLDVVGRDENFFDLGGNSLLAARIQARLTEKLQRTVTLLDIFTHPTVGALARHLSAMPEAPAMALEAQTQRQKEGLGRLKRLAKRVKGDE